MTRRSLLGLSVADQVQVEADARARDATRWIVERESALGPNAAYTGPMRSYAHADRERAAWADHGYRARVVVYDEATRARVRRWERGERWAYPDDDPSVTRVSEGSPKLGSDQG